jgi:hypothetical protein
MKTPNTKSDNATNKDLADRRVSIVISLVLVVTFVLLAIWAGAPSDFERCSALPGAGARNACYEQLRERAQQPPAKGANVPVGLFGRDK